MTTILTGDSREKLKELEDESIDALVTDPPYLINFMGKDWDKENSPAGDSSFWEEVLRVMKPGAHGLVFGHSRQHHRVMTALEDAGFEIRDCLMWLYGSGFPKSHNIGKAVDKLQGNKREVERHHIQSKTNPDIHAGGECHITMPNNWKVTKGNSDWEGWGTALKPAYEPIILVRKPLEKKLTIAKNVLKHGVGGINIDASRIGTQEDFSNVKPRKMMSNQGSVKTDDHDHTASDTWQAAKDKLQNLGRFPANVLLSHHPDCKVVGEVEDTRSGGERTKTIFSEKEPVSGGEGTGGTMKATTTRKVYECADDCAVKILDEQSGTKKGSGKQTKGSKSGGIWNKSTGKPAGDTYGDSGGASRFFYCAKVGKKERNAGDVRNTHPTVKPIKLMTYLTKLITPPNGKVLDPFMGSGSTGMACALEGFDFVGIDMDEEYVEVSKARIEWARTQKEND